MPSGRNPIAVNKYRMLRGGFMLKVTEIRFPLYVALKFGLKQALWAG